MGNPAAALYMRLSKEDDKGAESASIETQRKILQRYAWEQGFSIYREYVDDGYTGTNLNRPAFQQMLSDIEAGVINVVLTKDLSRLGRNSGRVNILLDEYFPRHRIRYISVSENIDTAMRSAARSIVMPVHNFANELYAADISNKIHAALHEKIKEGAYIGSFAPYGYRKDPADKNHLLIDPAAAQVVRRIFTYAAEGRTPAQIADILNAGQIPTPSQYRALLHPQLQSASAPSWNSGNVGKLLRNMVYLGATAQGKTEKPSFKSAYVYTKPKSEWVVVEHTHEPIVSPELWDVVRKRTAARTKNKTSGFSNLFAGLAKCADCGKSMSSALRKNGGACLVCGGYKLYGTTACTNHTIQYETLYSAVLDAVRKHFVLSPAEKSALTEELLQHHGTGSSNAYAQLTAEKKQLDYKIGQLFEDKYAGILPPDQFSRLLCKYNMEKNTLEQNLQRCSESQPRPALRKKIEQQIEEFCNVQALTGDLLFCLIDRIDIHQGEYTEGVKRQQIDIYFRFQCELKPYVFSCSK